jgi:hypothetical protein
MVKKISLTALLTMLGVQFCGAIVVTQVKDIDDIPRYCTNFAKILSQQPSFPGRSSFLSGVKLKLLPLNDENDCLICDILSKNARAVLGEVWCIQKFGFSADERLMFGQEGGRKCNLGCGIMLHDDIKKCSLKELKQVYVQVIEELKDGWYESTVQENPDIAFKKPENTWILYIKKKRLICEDILIRSLASKFEFSKNICCMSGWTKEPCGYEDRDEFYLWVYKRAFKKFKKLFKFHLEYPSDKTKEPTQLE